MIAVVHGRVVEGEYLRTVDAESIEILTSEGHVQKVYVLEVQDETEELV